MCPNSYKSDKPDEEMLRPSTRRIIEDMLTDLRRLSEPFVGDKTPPDMENLEEAAHKALKRLSDTVQSN
jgi:hypothetical protein